MTTTTNARSARFDLTSIIAKFPQTADTLLIDEYLTDTAAASSRVFRVYRGTPPHFHRGCDEYLYVLSGRGTFWMEDPSTEAEFKPGDLLFFERARFMRCRRSLRSRSYFCPLTHHAASRMISSSSTARTARL